MRRHLFVIALLLLVTFGVFSRVLQADFVAWDDEGTVPANTEIQGLDAYRLGWMFTNVSFAMRYKPLCWLTYALIHAGAGLNPLAYHLANLVFHCLNAVLLYFLIRELLLRRRAPQPETERESRCLAWCAGLGALAWALHPLRVEAVARVTDLTYCESLFFLLISLLCYQRANAGPQPAWGRAGFYWGDRKRTRLNSSHLVISYAVFCLKKTGQLIPALLPSPTGRAQTHNHRQLGHT